MKCTYIYSLLILSFCLSTFAMDSVNLSVVSEEFCKNHRIKKHLFEILEENSDYVSWRENPPTVTIAYNKEDKIIIIGKFAVFLKEQLECKMNTVLVAPDPLRDLFFSADSLFFNPDSPQAEQSESVPSEEKLAQEPRLSWGQGLAPSVAMVNEFQGRALTQGIAKLNVCDVSFLQ
jgi:hypothetical protein